MSEPDRLIQSGNDFERVLLESGRFDAPSKAARRRTLAALGVGTSILGASATASSTSVAAVGASWAFVKWVAIGALGGLAVVGGAEKAHVFPDAPKPAVVAQEKPAPVAAPKPQELAPPAPPPVVEQPKADVDDDKPAADAPKVAAPSAPIDKSKNAKPAASMSLHDQVATLDEAHKALASGDSAKALDLLSKHDGEFKAMGPEAQVLRIEALAARGDKAGAAAAANAFLAAYPNSAEASRVRSILANVTGGAP